MADDYKRNKDGTVASPAGAKDQKRWNVATGDNGSANVGAKAADPGNSPYRMPAQIPSVSPNMMHQFLNGANNNDTSPGSPIKGRRN